MAFKVKSRSNQGQIKVLYKSVKVGSLAGTERSIGGEGQGNCQANVSKVWGPEKENPAN